MKSWNNRPLNDDLRPHRISFLNQNFYVDMNEKYRTIDFLMRFHKFHKLNLALFLISISCSILMLIKGLAVPSVIMGITSTLYFLPLINLRAIQIVGIKPYKTISKTIEIFFLISVMAFLGVQLL